MEAAVHVPPRPFGVAMLSPVGRLSGNTLVSGVAVALGLLSVIVRVLKLPAGMVAGLKVLVTVGGWRGWSGVITRVALAALGLLPAAVCRAPAGIVLV